MAIHDASITSMQRLLPEIKSALQSFIASSSKFRILQTIPPHSSSSCTSTTTTTSPAPKTLYVLDSSFNPPTLAHLQIATSALLHDHGTSPKRLLLLLATQNADKAAKPAAFEHRLAMMTLFAHDLLAHLSGQRPPPHAHEREADTTLAPVAVAVDVDVAVTTEPYFHNKASAIAASGIYATPPPEQVHLTGFDTLVRLLDPKYYPPSHTLAPLAPFLDRHRVRVTYRTGAGWGEREAQARVLRDLGEGRREAEGGRREWVGRFEMVEGMGRGEEGVSSTRVREAVRRGDREALRRLLSVRVGEWVAREGLYLEGG